MSEIEEQAEQLDETEESDHEFSDPEDFIDEITDEGINLLTSCLQDIVLYIISELLGDLLQNRPTMASNNDTLIVVDNAPKVGPDRMGKLKAVLKKVLMRFGDILTEYYPMDENNNFKGLIIDYYWID